MSSTWAETADKIERTAKKKGVWGLCISMTVGKSGNSLDIRVSSRLAPFVGLIRGKEVLIHPNRADRLVIEVK